MKSALRGDRIPADDLWIRRMYRSGRLFFFAIRVCLPVFVCLLLATTTLAAIWPEDETPEQRYWKKVQALEKEARQREEHLQRERRAHVKATVEDLIKEGEAYQPELIVQQDGPPPPPPAPSLFERHPDHVLFGVAFGLIAVLVTTTLIRHQREAEIRALSGAYLSDGTEIAYFKMPALFETPVVPQERAPDVVEDPDAKETGEKKADFLAEFFASAREQLADMRQALPEISRAFDDDERQETLLKLYELISELKEKANCWDLRPVWQLTSALELLLKRLAEKTKETTPSTIRTIASAVDLLGELCVPDVRPDLIINPPISVLAVDDDPLCLRAVVYALQKADLTPETAKDGAEAVAMTKEKAYDVVFMDIMMPVMDGLKACSELHRQAKNETTPVVFVTARTDFRARTESTLVGGADLMAKPFLMFEITVKAVTYAMRKRLDLVEAGRRDLAALDALSRAEGTAQPVAA